MVYFPPLALRPQEHKVLRSIARLANLTRRIEIHKKGT